MLSSFGTAGPELYTIDPSGVSYVRYSLFYVLFKKQAVVFYQDIKHEA